MGQSAEVRLLVVLVACVTSTLLTWWMTRGAAALPQDEPNERSLHAQARPRSGGVAIVAGILAGLAAAGGAAEPALLGTAGLALALAVVSFFDDWRGLPVLLRLSAHLAAALAFAWLVLAGEAFLASAVAVLAIGWITNLYNFMDGSDGLAGGMAVIGFGAYAIAAASSGDGALASAAAAVAAAAAGFLFFNLPPARIFMGDVGSISLGFLAATLGVLGWQREVWPIWFPVLVFAPFVVDASVTLVRRALNHERVWEAHRSHYYQRLVQMGWGHSRTALTEYAVMITGAGIALAALGSAPAMQLALVTAAVAIYAGLVVAIERAWRAFRAGHPG